MEVVSCRLQPSGFNDLWGHGTHIPLGRAEHTVVLAGPHPSDVMVLCRYAERVNVAGVSPALERAVKIWYRSLSPRYCKTLNDLTQ